jgi:hypothetical protein
MQIDHRQKILQRVDDRVEWWIMARRLAIPDEAIVSLGLSRGDRALAVAESEQHCAQRNEEKEFKVPVAQLNSKRPLPPRAMLAATSPGTRRGEKSCRASYAKLPCSGGDKREGSGL